MLNMHKIDLLDKKIIAELDMNARIQISKLAKAVKRSREVVNYRLKTLTKKGIISGTQTFFNPAKLGYSLYRVLIRLDSLDKVILDEFQKYFIKKSNVMWFAQLGGKWDYIIEFFAKNANEFNDILNSLVNKFQDYIKLYETSTVLDIYCYKRKYIYNNKKEISFFILGEIDNIKLDKIDLKIANKLKLNAQLSNSKIADQINLSRNTIKYRIEKLKQAKVILGYKLFFHPQILGYNSYKLFFSMKNLNSKKETEFFEFAKQNPNVIFMHKNLGKWNYEFEIEVDNLNKLQNIIIETRIRFKDFILDYDLFPILHDYRIDLFPLK